MGSQFYESLSPQAPLMISKYIKKQRIKFLEKTERWASRNFGNGWGTETILEEISQIQELVPNLHPAFRIDMGSSLF
jgi:hypothetical protein